MLKPSVQANVNILVYFAIIVLGTISAITTAEGFKMIWIDGGPFRNIIAYAFAMSVSAILVYCSLTITEYFEKGKALGLIAAFTLFALLSLFFNFNAIYGIFMKEDITLSEIKRVRTEIASIRVQTIEKIDKEFKYSYWLKQVDSLSRKADAEEINVLRPGRSVIYQGIIDKKIDAMAESEASRKKFTYYRNIIDSLAQLSLATLDSAQISNNEAFQTKALHDGVLMYNEIVAFGASLVPEYEAIYLRAQDDIGKPDFALRTLFRSISFDSSLTSNELSSIGLAAFISFLLDFPIFLILVFLQGTKQRKRKKGQTDIFGEKIKKDDEQPSFWRRPGEGKISWE